MKLLKDEKCVFLSNYPFILFDRGDRLALKAQNIFPNVDVFGELKVLILPLFARYKKELIFKFYWIFCIVFLCIFPLFLKFVFSQPILQDNTIHKNTSKLFKS